jgi:hypothetical protein
MPCKVMSINGSYSDLASLPLLETGLSRSSGKRPYAFSDTILIAPHVTSSPPPSPSFEVPFSVLKPRFDCNWWVDKCISLTAHICLISLFETLFFFQYVSVSEDTGLLNAIDGYVDSIAHGCAALPGPITADIRALVTDLVPLANVSLAATQAAQTRAAYNHTLLVRSWSYFGGLLGVCVGLIGLARWRKYRIHIRRMVAENLALVGLLGIYEYVFFRTIVYNFTTLSHAELTWKVILNLNATCPVFG